MTKNFLTYLSSELRELRNTGLYKSERIITSKQAGTVALDSGWEVINLCLYCHGMQLPSKPLAIYQIPSHLNFEVAFLCPRLLLRLKWS